VNHTRFPKEDHLSDWARRYNNVTKGDRIEKPIPSAPYYIVFVACPAYHVFRIILKNEKMAGKKLLTQICFDFPNTLVGNVWH